MNLTLFSNIVNNPHQELNDEEIQALEKAVEDNPYSSVLHILLAKAYHRKQHALSGKQTKRAAIYTASRSNFRHFIKNKVITNTANNLKGIIEFEEKPSETNPILDTTTSPSRNRHITTNKKQKSPNWLSRRTSTDTTRKSVTFDFDNDTSENSIDQKKLSKEEVNSVISNFITKDPTIERKVPTVKNRQKKEPEIDFSARSIQENKNLVSETLAKLNAKQGNFQKAIQIYEQLILKYPEKRTYFTSQIDRLKNK